jgi:hypothetical protein
VQTDLLIGIQHLNVRAIDFCLNQHLVRAGREPLNKKITCNENFVSRAENDRTGPQPSPSHSIRRTPRAGSGARRRGCHASGTNARTAQDRLVADTTPTKSVSSPSDSHELLRRRYSVRPGLRL